MKPNRDNSPFKWDQADAERSKSIWKKIDDGVSEEANDIRVLKKVFMAPSAPEGQIFVEQIDSDTLAIKESGTRDYVEISVEFPLSNNEMKQEGTRRFAYFKAMEAATKIALAEDILFLQGPKAALPAGVSIDNPDQLTLSLLEAANDRVIPVEPLAGGKTYGENTFAAIAKGIGLLNNAPKKNYALFLDPASYADTQALFASANSGLSQWDRINSMVAGGFERTAGLPPNTGLLARLNGEPANIYYPDSDLYTEWFNQDSSTHLFRVCERFQYVVRKPKAFVKLNFLPLG